MSRQSLSHDAAVIREVARAVHQFDGYEALVDMAGEAHFVLIGEASHGTREFYTTGAELTRRLIQEKGFHAVALEADWPDTFRVPRFVSGDGHDARAEEALGDFRRFPAWMWRNTVMVEFVDWLRRWNGRSGGDRGRAGLYRGLGAQFPSGRCARHRNG